MPAAQLEPTVRAIAEQLAAPATDLANAYQQGLVQGGYATTSAQRGAARDQLLDQKLQPLYLHQLDAVVLQQLIADDKDKAQAALGQARAGAPLKDVAQQYASDDRKSDEAINSPGSIAPELYRPEGIRQLFPAYKEGDITSLKPGTCSDVQTVQAPTGQPRYGFICVVKAEQRAPRADETQALRAVWVHGLRAKYPVSENADLKLPLTTQ